MTALSVIAHGHSSHALEVGRAALQAARSLDESDAQLYTDLVFHHLDGAARQALEGEMALKLKNKYEYQSITFRRLIAEGKADGKRRALEVVLKARGLHLDDAIRQQRQNSDADELDALVVRAVSIEMLDELFEG